MQADFVIVGAGSAGCAMADRLSAAGASVIVIEF
ncbi:MAG: FAD-binding protein, partial [Marinovum sp.]|nr:FAD-binding protein [Marinovum sp.]